MGIVELTNEVSSAIESLLDYCKEYPWNSALHNETEEIYSEILKSTSRYPEGYRTAIIEIHSLPDFIASLEPITEFEESGRPM